MFYPIRLLSQFTALLLPALWGSAAQILLYVLTALALYNLCTSRGIRGAWLAWVPIANLWVLGSLSDQYSYLVSHTRRSKRVVLPALQLAIAASWILIAVVAGVTAMRAVSSAQGDFAFIFGYTFARSGMLLAGIALCTCILGIWYMIAGFTALYNVYRSCDPANAVLLLILSILIPASRPIILFLNRDKELGMPPRKTAVSEEQPM